MADPSRFQSVSQLPPPPPPLPPQRPSVLQRFIAPLAFSRPAQREQRVSIVQSGSASPKDVALDRPYRRPPPRAATHKTGISIAAIDVNQQRTHAIVAGKDILKTVKVDDRSMHEDLNIRSAVNNYISTQPLNADDVHRRREFLPAKDVRWSHHKYSHVVATAALNGRVALYDVSRRSSRVELYHFYKHTSQVNKLDFDPHSGYMLLSGSQDRSCQIWDIREPKKPQGYASFSIRFPVRDVRWSPTDAMQFALCTEDGTIQKWDIRHRQQPVLQIRAHEKACYTIAWHPDGKHLASGGFDKNLKIWDLSSDNRRQKPRFQLRCPASIMNFAWRPPCWPAEFAERATWQTTQIATSYTDADPRIHVWDLRRPLIPVRELNEYDSRPSDLLWADEDLLWSAGSAGVLVQNDISYAPHPEDSLPPGAIEWAVDGSFYSVVEDRRDRMRASAVEPSASFLNVPQERLTGVEDGMGSRSLTDDEGTDTSLSEQRQSRVAAASVSARGTKLQPNTPPGPDDASRTLPLDKAVHAKTDLLVNGQVAGMSQAPGLYFHNQLFEKLANGLARPMTAAERETDFKSILLNLETAFLENEMLCFTANLHREAEGWRTARMLVIPELKDWADQNGRRRLQAQATGKKDVEAQARDSLFQTAVAPFPKLIQEDRNGKSPARSEKLISNLFRAIKDSDKGGSDSGSRGGSNMTTPRQKPMNSTPLVSKPGATWYTLDDAIEPIQPLPPSIANSHSTAAAASRALLDTNSEPSDSPMPSPEKTRSSTGRPKGHQRSATDTTATQSNLSVKDSPRSKAIPTERVPTPLSARTQQDRRAALRDYKAPTRQPFSLDAPTASPRYGRGDRHDSSESFPMFSASTGSSARARSMGQSFGAPESMLEEVDEDTATSRQDSEVWVAKDSYYDSIGRSAKEGNAPNSDGGAAIAEQPKALKVGYSPPMPFGLDGVSSSKEDGNGPVTLAVKDVLAQSPRLRNEGVESPNSNSSSTRDVTAVDRFGKSGFFARTFPPANPMFHEERGQERHSPAEDDVNLESGYQASDFRPIDITKYEPRRIWPISAYPSIGSLVERDVLAGPFSCQFSAHLLTHLQPFFFHQSFRLRPSAEDLRSMPTSIADRLQNPKFSTRLIEGIFMTHIQYLENRGCSLAASNLRKFAVEEADFPKLAGPEAFSHPAGQAPGDSLKLDPRKLMSSCSTCKQPMPTSSLTCKHCKERRATCPVCDLPLTVGPDANIMSSQDKWDCTLATYCHACGHSVHYSCMDGWLALGDAYGECPTPHCGCDCAPGLIRDQRIARQMQQRDDEAVIRSSTSSATSHLRHDPMKAGPSPAVDKARDALRKRSSLFERETQSGDERALSSGGTQSSAWSRNVTSAGKSQTLGRSNSGSAGVAGSSGGATSFGRRVRVIEPGEDEN